MKKLLVLLSFLILSNNSFQIILLSLAFFSHKYLIASLNNSVHFNV